MRTASVRYVCSTSNRTMNSTIAWDRNTHVRGFSLDRTLRSTSAGFHSITKDSPPIASSLRSQGYVLVPWGRGAGGLLALAPRAEIASSLSLRARRDPPGTPAWSPYLPKHARPSAIL